MSDRTPEHIKEKLFIVLIHDVYDFCQQAISLEELKTVLSFSDEKEVQNMEELVASIVETGILKQCRLVKTYELSEKGLKNFESIKQRMAEEKFTEHVLKTSRKYRGLALKDLLELIHQKKGVYR